MANKITPRNNRPRRSSKNGRYFSMFLLSSSKGVNHLLRCQWFQPKADQPLAEVQVQGSAPALAQEWVLE